MPLVSAVQRQVLLGVLPRQATDREQLAADGELLLGETELLALERDGRVALRRHATQHLGRLRGLLGGHHGRALLDDAGLDLGDLGDRAAETVGVVDVDRREHRDVAVGGVRGVPLPTHAHLEHEHVDRRIGHGDERQHGQQFEERQRSITRGFELGIDDVDERLDLVPRIRDGLIGDGLAVDHDPLGEALQMWAREQSRAQIVRPQEALDHPRGRRLAVRTRDVHDAVRALRVIEEREDAGGALLARLHPALSGAAQQGLVDGIRPVLVTHAPAPILVTAIVKSPALAYVPAGMTAENSGVTPAAAARTAPCPKIESPCASIT